MEKSPNDLKFLVGDGRNIKTLKESKDQTWRNNHACGGTLGADLEKMTLVPMLTQCCSVTSHQVVIVVVLVLSHVQLFCNLMGCNPPGSSVHRISQARILGWVAISFSRSSSKSRFWTHVSYISRSVFITEPPEKPSKWQLSCPKM